MFQNLKIEQQHWSDHDVLSFDMTEAMMARFWAVLEGGAKVIERVGVISRLRMWDGDEGCFISTEGNGGDIFACMEEGRIFVRLDFEYDPADPTTPLGFEHNWIRFAPVLRWLKDWLS